MAFFRSRLSEAIGRIYDNRTTIGFELSKNPVRRLRDALGRVVEQMTVALEHHARVRVPEAGSDRERIFTAFDEERVAGVAQAMEGNVGQFRAFEQRLENAPDEVALSQRRPVGRGEDESGRGFAACLQGQQRFARERWKIDDAARLRRLRLGAYQLTVAALRQGLLDRNGASVKIDVIPAQREDLALTHAGRYRKGEERALR